MHDEGMSLGAEVRGGFLEEVTLEESSELLGPRGLTGEIQCMQRLERRYGHLDALKESQCG